MERGMRDLAINAPHPKRTLTFLLSAGLLLSCALSFSASLAFGLAGALFAFVGFMTFCTALAFLAYWMPEGRRDLRRINMSAKLDRRRG